MNPDDLMESMARRAAARRVFGSTIVTEHVGGRCVQCQGRPQYKTGGVSIHWFLDCRRSSKAKVEAFIQGSYSQREQTDPNDLRSDETRLS